MSKDFTSAGFDLDAVANDGQSDVIYEIGGGASVVEPPKPPTQAFTTAPSVDPEIAKAEDWKQQGNEQFKKGSYLEAYDLYTEAIEACPGERKGDAILKERDEFNETERAKAFARQRLDSETKQRDRQNKNPESRAGKTEPERPQPPPEYKLPPQLYGDKLAIYYCNRAAALIHMERFDDAIKDCDVSLLLNPKYTKAYVRRSAASEKSELTEDALRDAKKALELEPSNKTLRSSVTRLQKLEDERLEKLKAETMGKLKDLGNSLLGNFGLSLDNFQAVQDPNTGSYSISFNQNAGERQT